MSIKLLHENAKLFAELEFWKETALELGAPEDSYEECAIYVRALKGKWIHTTQERYTDEY